MSNVITRSQSRAADQQVAGATASDAPLNPAPEQSGQGRESPLTDAHSPASSRRGSLSGSRSPSESDILQRLLAHMQRVEVRMDSLEAENRSFRSQMNSMSLSPPPVQNPPPAQSFVEKPSPVATSGSSTVLRKKPTVFTGKRERLGTFITDCTLFFKAYPNNFVDDETKISFMISYFDEEAREIIEPLVRQEPQPLCLLDFKLFIAFLESSWSISDLKEESLENLHSLKQTGPADEYFREFRKLCGIIGADVNDSAHLTMARMNMSEYLKDELARREGNPKTFDDLVRWATRLDDRKRLKDEAKTRTRSTPKSSVPASSDIQTKPTSSASTPQRQFRRGPLDDEERTRRRENNLCAFCGDANHAVEACPALAKRDEARASKNPFGRQA